MLNNHLTPAAITQTANIANIVIIGAGLAGWSVVDAIRAKDKNIDITLITADTADRYHKPMLSTAFSQNKTREQLVRMTGKDAAKVANITLLAHTWVTAIHATTHELSLYKSPSNDKKDINKQDIGKKNIDKQSITLIYDKLVIATGASIALPASFAKLDEDLRHHLWHVNDLENFNALQTAINDDHQHIAVIGAGMVGTEIAEDLNHAGHHVSLIDIQSAPLSSLLPPIATARLTQALTQSGVELWMNKQVSNLKKLNHPTMTKNTAYQLTLMPYNHHATKAVNLQVHHVIISTGLQVNASFLATSGIEYHPRTGIVVNESTLQTSMADIYAIGDCMSVHGMACRYVAPLRAQAATIADEILGNEHTGYQHKSPMIRLKNKSISVTATGTPNGNGNWQIISDDTDGLKLKQIDEDGQVLATATIQSTKKSHQSI